MGLYHLGLTTESIVLSQDHFPVSPRLLSETNNWHAIIHQTGASPALALRDLEESAVSATQTDPVAPRGSSLSITQRNQRDGSWVLILTLALISRTTLPMHFILHVTQFPQPALLRRVQVTSEIRSFTEDLPCTKPTLLTMRKHGAFRTASAFKHSAYWRAQSI